MTAGGGRKEARPLFRMFVAIALIATAIIVSLSAYIRLSQAGAGCLPWPECFGSGDGGTSAFAPARLASQTHRLVASMLALVVMGLAVTSLRRPRSRTRTVYSWAALSLTAFLAVLGVFTPRSTLAMVTVGNLLGGFALLAVLWWLFLWEKAQSADQAPAGPPKIPAVALFVTLLALVAGAFAAAHLAVASCTPDCPWLPDFTVLATLDSFVAPGGKYPALGAHLHALHRAIAFLAALYLLLIAWRLRMGHTRYALLLAGLTVAQTVIGAAQARFGMPLSLGVAHNALAALMLLALLAGLRAEQGPA